MYIYIYIYIYKYIYIYIYKTSQYFLKRYKLFRRNINVKVDWSSYATKDDLKDEAGTDTSKLVLKTNWENLKAEIDKIDVDKLKTFPVDLSKLSNVVNNEVVKNSAWGISYKSK